MSFVACGLSHKTAPISLRERFYVSKEKIADLLKDLKRKILVNDAVILSTCNRTEIYCSPASKPEAIPHWLAQQHDFALDDLSPHLYMHQGEESVKHVFRVASGIDSMVLGEPQIFGQLKEAVSIAEKNGTLTGAFRKLFHHAFTVGKKIRTETGVGVNPVSLGQVIFRLSRKTKKDLTHARVLLIGAGETIEAIAQALKSHCIKEICIANRTLAHARRIADKIGAEACQLDKINLEKADLIISAISSDVTVFTKETVKKACLKKKQSKKIFFDLGVPRNMDPNIKKLKNVVLYSIDDLKQILDENREKRLNSVIAAEMMIDEYAKKFIRSLHSLSVSDAVKNYRNKMTAIRNAYLHQSLQALKTGENPEKVLQKFAHQLTNKFLHAPSVNLKKAACQENWILVHAVEKLWDI